MGTLVSTHHCKIGTWIHGSRYPQVFSWIYLWVGFVTGNPWVILGPPIPVLMGMDTMCGYPWVTCCYSSHPSHCSQPPSLTTSPPLPSFNDHLPLPDYPHYHQDTARRVETPWNPPSVHQHYVMSLCQWKHDEGDGIHKGMAQKGTAGCTRYASFLFFLFIFRHNDVRRVPLLVVNLSFDDIQLPANTFWG